ncbi:MAG: helix-turn-helix transcriptional regulator [Clostridia bacterium]|nr:helix-turn-helix transcriptional regulator [Clostridia bacterium]
MNLGDLISVRTVEDEKKLFGEGQKHTAYRDEIRLFSCVQQGDVDKLMQEIANLESSIITGKLSNDGIMQYKYLAVSVVTLAVRYAIQGGLNEKMAYEISDRIIMNVDAMESSQEILVYVASEIMRLTELVGKSKSQPIQSPYVRRCISYINENLSEKMTVNGLSDYCGISPDYLSQVFKEEMGENLSSYIIGKKLEKAKEMIIDGRTNRAICEALGFSSQSHFSNAFRKRYSMTPSEYRKLVR